jgi:hypothetical protein
MESLARESEVPAGTVVVGVELLVHGGFYDVPAKTRILMVWVSSDSEAPSCLEAAAGPAAGAATSVAPSHRLRKHHVVFLRTSLLSADP